MARVEVLSGDFPLGRAEFGFGLLVFPKKPKQGYPETIAITPKDELLSVEVADQSVESRTGKAASAGIAGGLLFGGVGLIVGGLLGAAEKQKKEVTFIATLTEKRRFLGKTDSKTFEKLQALAFQNSDKQASVPDDTLTKLERLTKLKEAGSLTESEFEQQKSVILASSKPPL